jgi:hypothetical protein
MARYVSNEIFDTARGVTHNGQRDVCDKHPN